MSLHNLHVACKLGIFYVTIYKWSQVFTEDDAIKLFKIVGGWMFTHKYICRTINTNTIIGKEVGTNIITLITNYLGTILL